MVNAGFAATVAARSACIINSREFILASHCRKVFVGSVDTKSSSHVSQLKSAETIKRDIHVLKLYVEEVLWQTWSVFKSKICRVYFQTAPGNCFNSIQPCCSIVC